MRSAAWSSPDTRPRSHARRIGSPVRWASSRSVSAACRSVSRYPLIRSITDECPQLLHVGANLGLGATVGQFVHVGAVHESEVGFEAGQFLHGGAGSGFLPLNGEGVSEPLGGAGIVVSLFVS